MYPSIKHVVLQAGNRAAHVPSRAERVCSVAPVVDSPGLKKMTSNQGYSCFPLHHLAATRMIANVLTLVVLALAVAAQPSRLTRRQSSGPSCPADSPASCSGSGNTNSCCVNDGIFLQTQFWDSATSGNPSPDSWTLHGLWLVGSSTPSALVSQASHLTSAIE